MSETRFGAPRPATERERRLNRRLRRAAAAAGRRYLSLPGVVGVGPGLRVREGSETGELCVQFLVRRRPKRGAPARAVPRFVYARDRRGGVDYRVKFPTDVIEVGDPTVACGGGSPVGTDSEDGTIGLIFRNRAERGSDAWYLVTCSHVASDLVDSPPDDPLLRSPVCASAEPFARTLKNALPERLHLAYDIALARISAEARAELGEDGLAELDGMVDDDGTRLTEFLSRDEIAPPLEIRCQLGVSGGSDGRIVWGPGSFQVLLDGAWLRVDDVFMTDVAAEEGDSGGIVFSDDRAVGLVFARSDQGRAWLQPLEPALDHLAALEPEFELRPF